MRHRAFTLVEIMIVVLIIGILLMMAIPQWVNARENSRQKACLSNLQEIDDAKEMWATQTGQADGAPCVQADLFPDYLRTWPSCPTSGTYTIGNVGIDATCSYQSGSWPHILPTN